MLKKPDSKTLDLRASCHPNLIKLLSRSYAEYMAPYDGSGWPVAGYPDLYFSYRHAQRHTPVTCDTGKLVHPWTVLTYQ